MSTDAIRQAYIDFFVQKHGHAEIRGASLIPENDPTVLFTTAGMHPLVPYLLGEKHPSGKRLVNCQCCVRTQDIDEVGDGSHLTFFEMLGNWSLGDYFKEGAIRMSLEFLTAVLGIPVNKLAVSCFGGDDRFPAMQRDEESAKIWESLGIPVERIAFLRGGMLESKVNWWGPAGHTGPCGPDTEMFYWIGSTELPKPGSNPANDEKNWLEIWNDVFMEYRREVKKGTKGAGVRYVFEPLAQKNVDTGMGLERVAQVLQGVESVYETDRMRPILGRVNLLVRSSSIDRATSQPALRPRAHLDAEPSMPRQGREATSNDARHARIIVDHLRAATFIIADGVEPSNVDRGYVLRRLIRRAIRSARAMEIEHSGSFTPTIAKEVIAQYGYIYHSLRSHEQQICSILQREEEQFGKTLQEGLKHFSKTSGNIDGLTAFHLYDTYGFPLELTKELATETGRSIDENGFRKAFKEHQRLSRMGAEKKFAGGLADHSAETTKLHTATHLLGAALRKVLGPHVRQKGSNITAERLRFDFNHPAKMTPEQITEVEKLVNDAIRADLLVAYHLTTVEEAKKDGAIGIFDQKYEKITHGREAEGPERLPAGQAGSRGVKVYVVGDPRKNTVFSKEICGGPHVAQTGMLGTFKIQKEESVAAGVRRIKATVSGGPGEITVAQEHNTE